MDITQLEHQRGRELSQIAILHIPRSSRQIPANERRSILLDDVALNNELLRMTDAYTDELFPVTPVGAGPVIFPRTRLFCRECELRRVSKKQITVICSSIFL